MRFFLFSLPLALTACTAAEQVETSVSLPPHMQPGGPASVIGADPVTAPAAAAPTAQGTRTYQLSPTEIVTVTQPDANGRFTKTYEYNSGGISPKPVSTRRLSDTDTVSVIEINGRKAVVERSYVTN